MPRGQSYRELIAWQKAMNLVTDVYRMVEGFPGMEMFGLASQLRRAIVSVPSNIAEGQGRDSTKEFIHHLSIAYGSLIEAETQIQIAANLAYIGQPEADRIIDQAAEVGRLMNGLSRLVRKSLTDN